MIERMLAILGIFSIYFVLSVISSYFLNWIFGEDYEIGLQDIILGIFTIPLSILLIILSPIIFGIKINRCIKNIEEDVTLLKKKLKIKEKKQ